MRDDELRRTLARAERPRAMSPEEEAEVLDRVLGPLGVDGASSNRRVEAARSSSRSTFWAAAAAIIAVVLVGAALLGRSTTEQVAVAPTSTATPTTTVPDEPTQPECLVVGSTLADAINEWGSIDDWAVTAMDPEPDLAQLALDALVDARSEVGGPPHSIDEELERIVDGDRNRFSADARGDAVRGAIAELTSVADGGATTCLDERLVVLSG